MKVYMVMVKSVERDWGAIAVHQLPRLFVLASTTRWRRLSEPRLSSGPFLSRVRESGELATMRGFL
jgi:hypothetical protein